MARSPDHLGAQSPRPATAARCGVALAALALHGTAHAHAAAGYGFPGWQAQPWVVSLLAISAGAYALGLARLWRRAGRRAGITPAQATSFGLGWVVLVLALCSPLESLSAALFTAHMVQHELLMVAAAPLLVLGRPLAAWAWALPRAARPPTGSVLRSRAVRVPWQAITRPFGAFVVHAAALWSWHIPALFNAALGNEALHALQHFSFLFSALLFWWAMLPAVASESRDGVAVLYLFGTMIHTGALGALLALSRTAWYAANASGADTWGMSALEDQQLGGLIMWIPAGTGYLVAALWLMARWLRESGSRAARRDALQ